MAWEYRHYRKIIKFKKDKCEICNYSKTLHLHHKDKNPRNSNLENLITVCASCHFKFHPRKNHYGEERKLLAQKYEMYYQTLVKRLKNNQPLTPRTSKYIRAYGKTAEEYAEERGISPGYASKILKNNLLFRTL